MTLTVEDGSIVTNANSYISTTNATTYATARGYTFVSSVETMLIKAMDYLESLNYNGLKYSETQALQWPRTGVYIDGYLFADDDIPQQLIDAQCEVAMAIDAGNDPLAVMSQSKRRVQVGEVAVEYASGSSSTNIVRTYKAKLAKLVVSGGFFTVSKA